MRYDGGGELPPVRVQSPRVPRSPARWLAGRRFDGVGGGRTERRMGYRRVQGSRMGR